LRQDKGIQAWTVRECPSRGQKGRADGHTWLTEVGSDATVRANVIARARYPAHGAMGYAVNNQALFAMVFAKDRASARVNRPNQNHFSCRNHR